MEISDDIIVLNTSQCKPCALAKAHRIISRFSDNAEISDKSFYRIIYDLMQLTIIINKDEWVSHFACHAIDFNMIFTHPKKSDATKIVIEALNLIETRYNAKIVFFRSDGERALKSKFDSILVNKEITFESSASDSPKQNDHSERKRGVLTIKARALRIDAGLPQYL